MQMNFGLSMNRTMTCDDSLDNGTTITERRSFLLHYIRHGQEL